MTHAIVAAQPGGPEVLQWTAVSLQAPGDREVIVRNTACAVNFNDVTQRTGRSTYAKFPLIPGIEAVGVVESAGSGAEAWLGRRVYYFSSSFGCYTQRRCLRVDELLALPQDMNDQTVASCAGKAITAMGYLTDFCPVGPGDWILIHAAAGGVGSFLCQLASAAGAIVIGTVSSDEKAQYARGNGCHHTIVYSREDFVTRVAELTGGRKVDVVFDNVGKDTFLKSLDCIRPRGRLIVCGLASGPIAPFDIMLLDQKGQLSITRANVRPTLMNPQALRASLEAVFDNIRGGRLRVRAPLIYPLREAERAHADLESRRTQGSVILDPA